MKKLNFIKHHPYFLAALMVVIVLVAISVWLLFSSIGSDWRGITPQFTGDSYFYYSRIKEIKDGNILIGNPFFWEHRRAIAPAFFAADWLAALPLLAGFSFNFMVVFNLFFWSVIFVFLIYLILRQLRVGGLIAALGALLVYFETFRLMFRPVSMQTIYPIFALFLLAFILWQKRPDDRKTLIFLIVAMTAAFYVYTYLWQIILVFILLVAGYFYFIKDNHQAWRLLIAIFVAHLLSVPLIILTVKQIMSPYYWESMERVALVYTRWPAANVFYSGIWVLAALLFLALAYYWLKKFKDEDYKELLVFAVFSGIAMLIVSTSNIITGKELENSQHVERFIGVWLVIIVVAGLHHWLKDKQVWRTLPVSRQIILLVLLLSSFGGIIRYVKVLSGANFFVKAISRTSTQEEIATQNYAQPLNWLANNAKEPIVVWVIPYTSQINDYLTINTEHYSLFAVSGENYLVSQKEVEERYLTSNYFSNFSLTDIADALWEYGGVGNAVHQYKTHNREVKFCRILRLNLFGYDCGQEAVSAAAFKGPQYFIDLYNQYQNEIKPNIDRQLKKFNVSYILVDKANSPDADLGKIGNINPVYQDKGFVIYKIDE
ncbi:MAG: hypothetical protein A3B04_02355 [Candidatus Portnoybacteria bacterium RIFCSPLOWO2_02_FULL_39_11]|uniref:Glycosyltransferase RgtA/B/C/D-like domain-containing protein n=1 Tax=Candidatus Portnoybacteria bacterium RIFCSPLOWO2_02_FULL_39_11 TaxID=1802001 RepID=A0A1G2FQW9_9BACT|nr:MAG: hypothetical protein A3B04_02355 [Candidatus Portnoybacteria bacterium RIFCSPLOWO2_02_FULL_39_11]